MEVEQGAGAKADLPASEHGHFGDPGPAVIHRQEERMIATSYPLGAIRGREEGLHFLASEIPYEVLVFSLEWDGQHAGGNRDTLWGAQGHKPEEGAQRRQANVARAHRVAALGLQSVEKPQDQRRIKIGHLQSRRLAANRLLDKGQQKTKGVPTTGDRVGTYP